MGALQDEGSVAFVMCAGERRWNQTCNTCLLWIIVHFFQINYYGGPYIVVHRTCGTLKNMYNPLSYSITILSPIYHGPPPEL